MTTPVIEEKHLVELYSELSRMKYEAAAQNERAMVAIVSLTFFVVFAIIINCVVLYPNDPDCKSEVKSKSQTDSISLIDNDSSIRIDDILHIAPYQVKVSYGFSGGSLDGRSYIDRIPLSEVIPHSEVEKYIFEEWKSGKDTYKKVKVIPINSGEIRVSMEISSEILIGSFGK